MAAASSELPDFADVGLLFLSSTGVTTTSSSSSPLSVALVMLSCSLLSSWFSSSSSSLYASFLDESDPADLGRGED